MFLYLHSCHSSGLRKIIILPALYMNPYWLASDLFPGSAPQADLLRISGFQDRCQSGLAKLSDEFKCVKLTIVVVAPAASYRGKL